MLPNIFKVFFAATLFFVLNFQVHAQCPDFGLTVSATKNACFGFNDGRISVKLSGSPFSYTTSNFSLWLRVGFAYTPIPASSQIFNGDSIVFTGLTPSIEIVPGGNYVVRFTDPSCAGGAVWEIYDNQLLRNTEILANGIVTAVCTGNDGEILVTPSGGTPPYGLVWSNGPTPIPDDETNPTGLLSGSYDLTITDAIGCTLDDTFVVDPAPDATLTSSGATTICIGTTTALQVAINNGTGPYTLVIDTTGAGTNRTINNYNSGNNIIIGPTTTNTYSLVSVTDNNGCIATVTGTVDITVNPLPTSNAGSDEATCAGVALDLSISGTVPSATNYSSLLWSSSGDGSYNDATALTPIYTPGAADIAAGTVSLTLQANGNGSCSPAIDDMILTITPAPTANAGSDEGVCVGDVFDLSASGTIPTAANFSSLLWSSSGDGSFNDATALTPIYTPGAADIAAGTVTLTLQANGNGSCAPTTDDMLLTISPDPTVNAGSDEGVCTGDVLDIATSATLPTATNFSSLLWSSSGDGSFNNATALTPIYTPGAADIAAGTVTLTLQANGNGSCSPVTDDMILTLTPAPTASAGSDEAICTGDVLDIATSATLPTATNFSSLLWSSSGDGNFNDATALTPIYTPGAADIATGTVTLTLQANGIGSCSPVTDDMILTLTPAPTASAGSDEGVCVGDVFDLSSSATLPTATNFSSLLWSSSGDGSFNDNSLLTPVYTPGVADIAAGTVTLTLQANGNGTCLPASDDMTLTITPAPTANAGSDEGICAGDVLDIATSGTLPTATNFSSLLWSSSGDGSFNDNSLLTPVYTPGAADIVAGTVTLTLQANGNGSCSPATDDMTLTITPAPTANAGSDEGICVGDVFDLNSSATIPTATNFSSLLWSSSGDGSFNDNSLLTPVYTPGPTDIAAGTVTLTLQANGNGTCAPATDDMTLTITPAPTANAGSDEGICAGDVLDMATSGTIPTATNFSSLLWSSSGDGSFNDATALTPIYTPGAADIAAGTVTLTLQANGNGTCSPASDDMTLTITPGPTANAGSDEAVCVGDVFDLSSSATIPTATNFSSLLWSSSGDGSFNDNSLLTPVYTPGVADIAAGTVTLTLQANGNGTCSPASDDMTLTITPGPTANAGSDEGVCVGDVFDLSSSATIPTAINFSSLLWSSSGDGSFNDATALTPIYSPGAADIAAGTVTLTLQANGIGTCAPATDNMVLLITPDPTANAGSDEETCEGVAFDLSTSGTVPSATNFSSLLWSSSGDGSFNDATALTPIYTPGAADIVAGTVTLTLQANGNGSCVPAADDMILTFTTPPTADLSGNGTICPGASASLTVNLTGTAPWVFVYNNGTSDITENINSSPYTINVNPLVTTTFTPVSVSDARCTGNVSGTATIDVTPPKEVTIRLDSIAGTPGSLVKVPVRVIDYADLMTMQFTVAWDPNLLTFNNVTDINLGNVSGSSFGTTEVNNGFLTFSWNTISLSDTTIQDSTAIFAVEFNMANTVCSDAYVTIDESPTALTPIEIADENLCIANVTVKSGNVENQAVASIASSDPDNIICFGEQVIFTGLPGGMTNYQFYLNGAQVQSGGNNVFINDALVDQDSVNVIVGDAQGCSLAAQGIITAVDQIVITPTVTDISSCGLSDGAISLAISGGSGTYTFSWTGPSIIDPTLQDQSSLGRGFYSVIVSDDVSGCTQVLDIELSEPVSFTLTATKSDVSSTGGNDGSINLTITGGTGPFDVAWSGPNGFTSTDQDLINLYAGVYIATITDVGEGCTDALSIEILQPINTIILNATKTDVTTCGAMDGTINLLITGGSGSFAISWIGPNSFTSNSQNLSGLEGGLYIATVIDLISTLTSQWTVQLDEPQGFSINATVTELTYCDGADGTITLFITDGSGDFSYSWKDLVGLGYTSTDKDIIDLELGVYRVVVTDNVSGCLDSLDVTVGRPAICDQPCALNVESTTNNTSCPDTQDGVAVINIISGGSGPGNYFVSLDTGKTYIPFEGMDITAIINQGQGSYLYIAKDTVTGCLDTTIANVGVSTNLMANISVTNPGCAENDGIITFNVGGGIIPFEVDIIDSVGNVTSRSGNGFFQFMNLNAGSYFYTVREQSGCLIIASDSIELSVDCISGCSALIASASNFEDATCGSDPNGKAIINVTGGSSPYEYSTDGVNWIPFISGNVVDKLPPNGIYNIVVRQDADNPDCRAEVSVEIYGPELITLESPIITVQKASCNQNDGAVKVGKVIGGTGVYNYQLDGSFFTLASDSIITDLGAGIHVFSVVDAVGCVADFEFEVESPGVIVASATDVPVSCTSIFLKAGIRIEVDLDMTTLPGPYEAYIATTSDPDNGVTYQIPDNGIRTILNLDKDFYNVTITSDDAGGCSYSETISVFSGAYPLDFEIIDSDSIVSCIGDYGSITIGNVIGDPDTTFIVQLISESNVILETYALNRFELEGGFTIDESNTDKLVAGKYYIKMIQNQNECAGVEAVSELITIYEPLGQLGFEVIQDEVSLADRPTGSITGEVKPSGGDPYEVLIQLVDPLFEMNVTTIIEFNEARSWEEVPSTGDNLNRFPVKFDSLWAGLYEITVRDAYGCEFDLEHNVGYDETVFIPNVFTPNNDGYNDSFYIRNLPESGTQVIISNRNGSVIFESDNYNYDNLWDGGNEADGIYFYRISMPSGESYRGWVEKWSGSRP